jgi:hypothetical protein
VCCSPSVPPRTRDIGKVSLLVRVMFLLCDFPLPGGGCPFHIAGGLPPTSCRDCPFPICCARTPLSGTTACLIPPFLIFSSSLFFTSFSRIRISGHILCSFSQVSHPSQHHPSMSCSILILTLWQLWSHYQSRTLQKFDIYDPVSPFHHPIFFSPLPALIPPHPTSSSPALAREVCVPHPHRSPSKFARPYPSLPK